MKFSYTEVWNDTVRMMRANASLLLAIAGVFLFLPGLLLGYFAPQPEAAPSLAEAMENVQLYFVENAHWLVLANTINMIGAIAIYVLLFEPQGRTVGGAIAAALPILPMYFILAFLSTLIIVLGFMLLILPGIYLVGRLAVASALMVAEHQRNPLTVLGNSWRLTKGRGWAVAGLVVIIAVVGWILTGIVSAVLGSVFVIVGGQEGLGGLLTLILDTALSALFSLVLVVLFAAIYRSLGATASVPRTAAD
jgi:hypothetical protein